MPSYSSSPYTLADNEFLKGKSLFHWCRNTHLHSRRRMFNWYRKHIDSWGKEYITQAGWYCPTCGIVEGRDWEQ